MHFVLELKVILVYLRAVLLVYFLYKVLLLDILKAAIRESVSKMVADLGDGILVVCWGHWRSRCRHWWRFICCRTSFRWNLPQFHTSLCHSLRETPCYTRPRWDDRSCHTTRGRNGKPSDDGSGQSTRTRNGKPDDGDPGPRTKGSIGSAHGEPGSHAGIGHRDELSPCWM